MDTGILDGKYASDKIKQDIANQVQKIKENGGKCPHLAAILVGNDGASQTYVGNKERSCQQVGFDSTVLKFEDTITENELLEVIYNLNNDSNIDGIIVQLPLPSHIDENKIIWAIDPKKDVDGYTIGDYTDSNPSNIIALIRNKFAHGKYSIDYENKIINLNSCKN